MITGVEQYERGVAEVLRTSTAFRDQQIAQSAEAYVAAQASLDQHAAPSTILALEAMALAKRIRTLGKHRTMGKLLVGSQAKMIPYDYDEGWITPLFFASESIPTDVDDVREGFRFIVPHKWSYPEDELHISREVSGVRRAVEVDWWHVSVHRNETGGIDEVAFDSQACKSERTIKRQAILNDYRARYPQLDGYRAPLLDGGDHPEIDARHLDLTTQFDPTMTREKIDHAKDQKLRDKPVVEELRAQLTRGIGWDYDGDVYSFPLGLIMHARGELAPRWRKK